MHYTCTYKRIVFFFKIASMFETGLQKNEKMYLTDQSSNGFKSSRFQRKTNVFSFVEFLPQFLPKDFIIFSFSYFLDPSQVLTCQFHSRLCPSRFLPKSFPSFSISFTAVFRISLSLLQGITQLFIVSSCPKSIFVSIPNAIFPQFFQIFQHVSAVYSQVSPCLTCQTVFSFYIVNLC